MSNSYILKYFHIWISTGHISVSDSIHTYIIHTRTHTLTYKWGGERRNKNTTPVLHTVWHISLSLNLQYILQFSFGVGNILLVQKEMPPLWPELISSLVPPTWLHKHHTLLPSCDALCTLEKPTVNHKSLSSECTTSCLHFAKEASRGDSFLPSPFPFLSFSLTAPSIHWTALIKPINANMWSSVFIVIHTVSIMSRLSPGVWKYSVCLCPSRMTSAVYCQAFFAEFSSSRPLTELTLGSNLSPFFSSNTSSWWYHPPIFLLQELVVFWGSWNCTTSLTSPGITGACPLSVNMGMLSHMLKHTQQNWVIGPTDPVPQKAWDIYDHS